MQNMKNSFKSFQTPLNNYGPLGVVYFRSFKILIYFVLIIGLINSFLAFMYYDSSTFVKNNGIIFSVFNLLKFSKWGQGTCKNIFKNKLSKDA